MKDLYLRLQDAYSESNLNRITGELISLYKSGESDLIRSLAEKISKYVQIDEEKGSRIFTRLIMLYHPDKGTAYRETIDRVFKKGDAQALKHSPIF